MEAYFGPLSFFALIVAGKVLSDMGFFQKFCQDILIKLVLNITVPCAAISAFGDVQGDGSLLWVSVIGFFCAVIPLLVARWATAGYSAPRRAFYLVSMSGSSLGCFMLPLLQNFWGSAGAVLVCVFDVGNAIMTTGGSYALTVCFLHTEKNMRISAVMKRFFRSVAVDTYLILLLCIALEIRIPQVILELVRPAADANAFLSMLMVGMVIRLPRRDQWPDVLKLLLGRMAFAAAFSALIRAFAPFPPELRTILALIPFAPIGVLAPVYVDASGGDRELASFANSASVLLSLFITSALCILLLQ